MGYWPSKLSCILNVINQTGWGIIGCIIAGQMFSAVNGGGMSIAVGCVVCAVCVGLISIFGIAIVHKYERCVSYGSFENHATIVRRERRPKKAYGKSDTLSSLNYSPSLSSLAPRARILIDRPSLSVLPVPSPQTAVLSSLWFSPP